MNEDPVKRRVPFMRNGRCSEPHPTLEYSTLETTEEGQWVVYRACTCFRERGHSGEHYAVTADSGSASWANGGTGLRPPERRRVNVKPDRATLCALLDADAEWIKDWHAGAFDSGSRDSQGWPMEMHSLVADLKQYVNALPGLLDDLEETEKARDDWIGHTATAAQAKDEVAVELDVAVNALDRVARWLEDRQDPPRHAAVIAREVLARIGAELPKEPCHKVGGEDA